MNKSKLSLFSLLILTILISSCYCYDCVYYDYYSNPPKKFNFTQIREGNSYRAVTTGEYEFDIELTLCGDEESYSNGEYLVEMRDDYDYDRIGYVRNSYYRSLPENNGVQIYSTSQYFYLDGENGYADVNLNIYCNNTINEPGLIETASFTYDTSDYYDLNITMASPYVCNPEGSQYLKDNKFSAKTAGIGNFGSILKTPLTPSYVLTEAESTFSFSYGYHKYAGSSFSIVGDFKSFAEPKHVEYNNYGIVIGNCEQPPPPNNYWDDDDEFHYCEAYIKDRKSGQCEHYDQYPIYPVYSLLFPRAVPNKYISEFFQPGKEIDVYDLYPQNLNFYDIFKYDNYNSQPLATYDDDDEDYYYTPFMKVTTDTLEPVYMNGDYLFSYHKPRYSHSVNTFVLEFDWTSINHNVINATAPSNWNCPKN